MGEHCRKAGIAGAAERWKNHVKAGPYIPNGLPRGRKPLPAHMKKPKRKKKYARAGRPRKKQISATVPQEDEVFEEVENEPRPVVEPVPPEEELFEEVENEHRPAVSPMPQANELFEELEHDSDTESADFNDADQNTTSSWYAVFLTIVLASWCFLPKHTTYISWVAISVTSTRYMEMLVCGEKLSKELWGGKSQKRISVKPKPGIETKNCEMQNAVKDGREHLGDHAAKHQWNLPRNFGALGAVTHPDKSESDMKGFCKWMAN